jgi:Rieske Fe-S protein
MDRRTFTKSCIACIAGASFVPMFSSCQSTHYASGIIEPNGLSVSKSEFTYSKKDQPMMREYIIVRNDKLEFHIYLYRFSDNEYSALLMKCSHQGNELQASGDHLHCSAHGSEFNNMGVVAQGPAENNLRSFKVTENNERIFIDLRS